MRNGPRDRRRSAWPSVLLLVASSLAPLLNPAGAAPADEEAAFRELYRELIEINTTLSAGSCTKAAEAMRERLLAAGFPAEDTRILVPPDRPKDGNLIAVLHGTDPRTKAILMLAHIDVVEAKREDWSRDPFRLVLEDGVYYARGASDDKAMAAVFTDNLIRYRTEGLRPRHDIKLALTCGEETPDQFNGVNWLSSEHPDVLAAEFALNEGAAGELDAQGRHIALQVQAGEKVYQDFALDVTDAGGHSARPRRDNAIVRLSAGLARLGAYQFPIVLNDTTRAYFEARARLAPPEVAADIRAVLKSPPDAAAADRLWTLDPAWNSTLRTTCIPTMIDGGHANNAAPQHAHANVNCRILPGVPIDEVEREIRRVLADERIVVERAGDPGVQTLPPPLSPRILDPVREVAQAIWPGVIIVPTMTVGATDGRFLNARGVPTYGLSGMFHGPEGSNAHGRNEHIGERSLLDGRRFLYEVVKRYAD